MQNVVDLAVDKIIEEYDPQTFAFVHCVTDVEK